MAANLGTVSQGPKVAYARKLILADLAAETRRARALAREALAERSLNPAASAKLSAVAQERLALIAAENAQRQALRGTLRDGSTVDAFARTLSTLPDPALGLQGHLLRFEAAGAAGSQGHDARLKLLAVEREAARREAEAEAKGFKREATRLETLKQQYDRQLEGFSPARLASETQAEGDRLATARATAGQARAQLAGAATWADRRRAEAAVAKAERTLRTEYARRSVLGANTAVRLDRGELHRFADSLEPLGTAALAAQRSQALAAYRQMTTGGIRGDRQELGMQRARMAIVDAAIARLERGSTTVPDPVPPPAVAGPQKPGAKHPTAGAQVWKEPGVFVWHPGAFPADIAVAKLKAQGIKWVALQIADGTTVNAEAEQALAAGYIQKLHAAGIKVGFWGVNRLQPEEEANLAAELVKKWGADFYIANAEIEYKYTDAQGKPSPENFERSKRWVDTFRKALPDVAAGLSSYGRTDLADLDWKTWRDAGFDLLPQTYLNEFDIYDPKLSVEAAVKNGWPRDQVHPTLGLWGGGQSRVVPASEYVASLRQAGSVGFSSYLAEQMSDEDWRVLGEAIRQGGLTE